MRRLWIVLGVVVVLLVVADRLAAVEADHLVAARIQTQENLPDRPDVSIGGFPFLTQAIGGTYSDVTLTVHHFRRSAVPVDTITVHLHGVHVPLHAVFGGHLSSVPVDSATATLLVSYADLNNFFGVKGITLSSGGGNRLKVSGSVTVAGQTLSASGEGSLDVSSDSLVVEAGNGVRLPIPLGGLPFRIELQGAKATSRGIEVTASAQGLVLHPRG